MTYKCDICNYSTDRLNNYSRHINSSKHKTKNEADDDSLHIENATSIHLVYTQSDPTVDQNQQNNLTNRNLEKEYECEICMFKTVHKSSYYRHKTKCIKADAYKSTKIIALEQKIDSIKDEEIKYLKSLVNNAGLLAKQSNVIAKQNSDLAIKSMSALTYIIKTYPNAPALELVPDSKYEEMSAPNCDLATTIVHYYKKKRLHKYLGDYVVEFYKKEPPGENSVWTSDVVRETFIYRQMVGDELDWVVDKVAKKIGKKIIDPMLEYIKIKLKIYNEIENKLSKNMKLSVGEMGVHVKNNTDGMDIILSIENNTLKDQILKYIAPFFYLDKSLTYEPSE